MSTRKDKKILVGVATNGTGGVDSYILSFVRVAHENGIRCDVISTNYDENFADKLLEHDAKLIEVSNLHDKKKLAQDIKKICSPKKDSNGRISAPYSAAYLNISTAIMYPYAAECYKAGIKNIVVHAHAHYNSQPNWIRTKLFDFAHYYYRRKLLKLPIKVAACSQDCAEWIAGTETIIRNNWTFVPNPIDVKACTFSEARREEKTKQLEKELNIKLTDKTIIGTATAFMPYKNPLFLIDVFAEYLKINDSAYLLVAGDGPMREEMIAKAKKFLPQGTYTLLGHRNDVHDLLQVYDAFVLPSENEGLPLCILEAQASGLPCIMSDTITEESIVENELVRRIPLKEGAAQWAEAISSIFSSAPKRTQESAKQVCDAGFNLSSPETILPCLIEK